MTSAGIMPATPARWAPCTRGRAARRRCAVQRRAICSRVVHEREVAASPLIRDPPWSCDRTRPKAECRKLSIPLLARKWTASVRPDPAATRGIRGHGGAAGGGNPLEVPPEGNSAATARRRMSFGMRMGGYARRPRPMGGDARRPPATWHGGSRHERANSTHAPRAKSTKLAHAASFAGLIRAPASTPRTRATKLAHDASYVGLVSVATATPRHGPQVRASTSVGSTTFVDFAHQHVWYRSRTGKGTCTWTTCSRPHSTP